MDQYVGGWAQLTDYVWVDEWENGRMNGHLVGQTVGQDDGKTDDGQLG